MSKIIQITGANAVFLALCEDGSTWYLRINGPDVSGWRWERIPDPQ
jgi:hypothetical protein